MLSMVVFSHFNVAVDEGRSAFPVYASAYAPQWGLTARSGINGGSASNVEVSRKGFISEAENPRHLFRSWVGLQRRLDWKCASSYVALVSPYKLPLNIKQNALKARSKHKLSVSTVTCLEGDRPNEERIQATGRHVTVLLPTTNVR